MRARRFAISLTIMIVVASIIFSSFHVDNVGAVTNSNSAVPVLEKSDGLATSVVSESCSAVVVSHRVTATEIQVMKNGMGVSVEGQDYNQIVDGYGTGLRAPTTSEWQELSQTAQVADSITYPMSTASVDNSLLSWFPPIGNQGSEGSCVAWSVGYYIKSFQEAKEHGWNFSTATWTGTYPGYPSAGFQDKVMSPEFLYNLIDDGTDNGASFEDAVNLTCSIGVCSWQKMPYSQSDHSSWPSEAAWNEAPYYRGNSSGIQYLKVSTASGIESLKNWLAAGNLASIGVDASFYSKLTSADVWTSDNYKPRGASAINHANTVVGYDDSIAYTENGTIRQGAFKVANSWGRGPWENVADGFYWISYEAMRQRVGATSQAMFYYDMINYQPELLATFKISHTIRGDCQITVGVGSTTSPIATKSFTQYINGGSFPFPANNMVMDITEFANKLPRLYNQSYYLRVRDSGSPYGTSAVGTVMSFSVGNVSSSDAPKQTVNNNYVYLTVFYAVLVPELSLSPTSGTAGTTITLNGASFTPSKSVNISYLNPLNSRWLSIVNNTVTNAQGQFNVNVSVPDLMQSSMAGDHPAVFDAIAFRVVDNANGLAYNASISFSEWRRGLTRVGNMTASGLYGNNTNLTSLVAVNSAQSMQVECNWFSPGNVTIYWDGTTYVGTALANQTGYFAASFTVPTTTAGRHEIVVRNGNVDFHVSIACLPSTVDNYDGVWHTSDFTINLTPNANNCTTYYRINGGLIRQVATHGQALIATEGSNNNVEYWSVDEFGNEETPHKTVTNVKLDKTAPFGSIQINNEANYTRSIHVTLTLTADDVLSGVKQVRFSNDGVWDTETWETLTSIRNWTLTLGDGMKTVSYQIMDNAGLTASYSASVMLDTTTPSVNAGQNQTVKAGNPVNFMANECQDNVGISSSVWNFGDGTDANGMTTTHTYSSPGNYTVTLTVQDLAGNTATSRVTVTVQNSLSSTDDTIPEFPSVMFILPLTLVVTLVSLIIRRKSFVKNKKRTVCFS